MTFLLLSSSTDLNGRAAMIFLVRDGPMPGRESSWSGVAVLRLIGVVIAAGVAAGLAAFMVIAGAGLAGAGAGAGVVWAMTGRASTAPNRVAMTIFVRRMRVSFF